MALCPKMPKFSKLSFLERGGKRGRGSKIAIGFRGKFFLRCQVCLWTATDRLYGKKWGCSSDSL